MKRKYEQLAHSLKLRYGLAPYEPDETQIENIVRYISEIDEPQNSDWTEAVRKYCPTFGRYSYAGIDNSDLNTLLAMAIGLSPKK